LCEKRGAAALFAQCQLAVVLENQNGLVLHEIGGSHFFLKYVFLVNVG